MFITAKDRPQSVPTLYLFVDIHFVASSKAIINIESSQTPSLLTPSQLPGLVMPDALAYFCSLVHLGVASSLPRRTP